MLHSVNLMIYYMNSVKNVNVSTSNDSKLQRKYVENA
jgi:hypothetical protein